MQVVVPMSGFGERFRRAGYDIPKPLIRVDGRPIIGHVCDMFPDVEDIIFICNTEHLSEPSFRMEEILRDLRPNGRIVPVPPVRQGPVQAILNASHAIDVDRPTVINYCDFTCFWDFGNFTRFVQESACDGAIPAYTGFHPHMLGSTNYAYVRERDGWVLDIQEKKPFTDTPMSEYASSGTYYFRSGALALECCRRSRADDSLLLNGEHYVSLAYKPLLTDGGSVAVYPLQHFMQWGTPEDLATYRNWSRAFRRLAAPSAPAPRQEGAVMIPLAGAGSRFVKEGYALPKPLIPVSGSPMVLQATSDLPQADNHVFILRADLPGRLDIEAAIQAANPSANLKILDAITDGQARTCLMGLDDVQEDAPLTIGACDNGVLYDPERLFALLEEPLADVIVWVARGHANAVRHPHMYGWVDADGDRVRSVSVKQPLSDPKHDPIVIGTFTFRRARDFKSCAEHMIARNARVNGEFYVDTCINDAVQLGLSVRIMEVDGYLSWGTPDELRTFNYWQSCFHKWPHHPYSLEKDRRVPASQRASLERVYAPEPPRLPVKRP
ncbi:NTP transferase domain-containing protein [Aquabacter sp. P-9]|uniref:NTP transferase domain-containing protein n=1 Tax=Aquabacter sediminis TaxID=3029197 RepID=UPI00237D7B31|nr:NTP transferase domain-containing protein [Aquabacter sp. P-9]MDE1567244.1 NTP transferase domain-containing protein [Aquabacter sp. P-9]